MAVPNLYKTSLLVLAILAILALGFNSCTAPEETETVEESIASSDTTSDGSGTTTTTDNSSSTTDSTTPSLCTKENKPLGDVNDPIIIPTHNWTSQIVMSNVVGQLFQKMGYKVQYTVKDSQAVYEAIRIGDVHIELEVWESSFAQSFNVALNKVGILDAGTHDAIAREDWWVPNFTIEKCSGLPNWEALNGCVKLFARTDSGDKGVYVASPAQWGNEPAKRIEALGLNFTHINVANADALWPELKAAKDSDNAIVLFNWSPNFTDALYGGQFVKFPAYDEKCTTDASWGINPDMTHDCGNPDGYLKKAAWGGMPDKWPAAYQALTCINFNTNHIGKMALYVDLNGMTHVDAATKWINENESVWTTWPIRNSTSSLVWGQGSWDTHKWQ